MMCQISKQLQMQQEVQSLKFLEPVQSPGYEAVQSGYYLP